MTADAMIDYDSLQQEALRGMVRAVLHNVAKSGLPGDHHLYISFDVRAPGVVLSKRLREKYPHEMTIVLQHRFWDLAVGDERFEVKLTFDGIPERLVVPFRAIKVFLDPSVRYVLHFEDPQAIDADAGTNALDIGDEPKTGMPRSISAKKTRAPRPRTRAEREAGVPGLSAVPTSKSTAPVPSLPASLANKAKPSGPVLAPAATAPQAPSPETALSDPQTDTEKPTGAQVVSLDAFRKK